ncbi:hypothetical protein AB0B45_22085 [Nonomuraea sp. NPDC049152]
MTRTPEGTGKKGRSLVLTTLTISTSWSAASRPARLKTVRMVPPMP